MSLQPSNGDNVTQTSPKVTMLLKGGGGGGDFELGVGGGGQDTSRHFEGSFRSIRAILPM